MVTLPAVTDASLTLQDRVAVLTFDRDDLRNALTGTTLIEDILSVAAWVNAEPAVSVLVLTGAGRAFSSGGNVKEMQDRDGMFGGDVGEVARNYQTQIQRIPLALDDVEVPIIAAVNGPAIGAGCDLTCMCDLRIASEKALFGETFVNLGIIPGDGGAWLLQRLIGYGNAASMALTGRLVRAEEALSMGLVQEVVPADQLMDRTLELAAMMAAKPPQALRQAKQLMKMAQRMEMRDFLKHCSVIQGMCHNSDEHMEAVTAFIEKRPAKFD
ncbi:enoyl-CoA hydratase-related protein [Rhodovibrionaceae bacterium A322]